MPSHRCAALKPIEVSPITQAMPVRSNAFVTLASIKLMDFAEEFASGELMDTKRSRTALKPFTNTNRQLVLCARSSAPWPAPQS